MRLLTINHQSLVATKANRIVRAAQGRAVMEFGSRRAQGPDGAIYGARAAYIGGCCGTACTICGRDFGIPALGTMAHSWVQLFPSELDAFRAYAKQYPSSCTLLVDTYNAVSYTHLDVYKRQASDVRALLPYFDASALLSQHTRDGRPGKARADNEIIHHSSGHAPLFLFPVRGGGLTPVSYTHLISASGPERNGSRTGAPYISVTRSISAAIRLPMRRLAVCSTRWNSMPERTRMCSIPPTTAISWSHTA